VHIGRERRDFNHLAARGGLAPPLRADYPVPQFHWPGEQFLE
jgi:hypothetical protein